ncbi:hypothetical protein MMC26_004776 [Xylographa opegraphella]|nr:hypothetical protein [Xylographa opegraphella]
MSVVVPSKTKQKRLQASYTLCSRRHPRIYVEYLDEKGAVIRDVKPVTPPVTGVPQKPEDAKSKAPAPTDTKKKGPAGPYTSQDASTQTDFFWCALPTKLCTELQTQSTKKQSKEKDSRAVAQETHNPARHGVELKPKQPKSSKSEADVLAIIEEAARGKSSTSKESKAEEGLAKVGKTNKKSEKKETEKRQPDKHQKDTKQPPNKQQPEKKQPLKAQSGKKEPDKQRANPTPLKQVRFTHLPRFRDPYRHSASSSSSSASDESNTDLQFAASMAQAASPGHVRQLQEPKFHGTPAQEARNQEQRRENDMIRRSVDRADNLERVRKMDEEAAAERADETAAQQWLHERNAESSQAAAAWLGDRQAARSQRKRMNPDSKQDQMELRLADEQEAARWVERRAKERYGNLADLNIGRAETESPHHQDLNAEGCLKSPSSEEAAWDSTRNANWTTPSEWANLSRPQKEAPSVSAPRIWEDMENSAESQVRRVSFASPHLTANSDPKATTEKSFLNEMDLNTNHIPQYRRHSGPDVAQALPLYKPHSKRRSAYESLPEPLFVINPSRAASQSTQKSSNRTRSAPVVKQRYEMSGALHESEARADTGKKNKKKVHYEGPSVNSADSDEDSNSDMLWVE